MTPTQSLLDLADWRRRVGDLYRIDGPNAIERFRLGRDQLFHDHPQSPLTADARASFAGLRYFPPDPRYVVKARLEPADLSELEIDTGGEDGVIRYRRAGRLEFMIAGERCGLTVFSLIGYGGGLFLPFRDGTSARETYGAGRYLFDTPKNTDGLSLQLTAGTQDVTIDFNYSYNPSCAYDARWCCPLAPRENWLSVDVRAGEMAYEEHA